MALGKLRRFEEFLGETHLLGKNRPKRQRHRKKTKFFKVFFSVVVDDSQGYEWRGRRDVNRAVKENGFGGFESEGGETKNN